MNFNPKEGVQGLGYRGLDPGLALHSRGGPEHIDLFNPQSQTGSLLFGDATRVPRRGGLAGQVGLLHQCESISTRVTNPSDLQAFGLGALEDDDDEEVYHRDSMSRYDTVIGGEEPGDGLYGWTAPQQYSQRRGALEVPRELERPILASEPLSSYSQGNPETAHTWEGSWRASLWPRGYLRRKW